MGWGAPQVSFLGTQNLALCCSPGGPEVGERLGHCFSLSFHTVFTSSSSPPLTRTHRPHPSPHHAVYE